MVKPALAIVAVAGLASIGAAYASPVPQDSVPEPPSSGVVTRDEFLDESHEHRLQKRQWGWGGMAMWPGMYSPWMMPGWGMGGWGSGWGMMPGWGWGMPGWGMWGKKEGEAQGAPQGAPQVAAPVPADIQN